MDHEIETRFTDLENKIDLILEILQKDVQPNCKKMSSHIDFVDNVYENVKNPLGFICSKVSKVSGNEPHSLTDK